MILLTLTPPSSTEFLTAMLSFGPTSKPLPWASHCRRPPLSLFSPVTLTPGRQKFTMEGNVCPKSMCFPTLYREPHSKEYLTPSAPTQSASGSRPECWWAFIQSVLLSRTSNWGEERGLLAKDWTRTWWAGYGITWRLHRNPCSAESDQSGKKRLDPTPMLSRSSAQEGLKNSRWKPGLLLII